MKTIILIFLFIVFGAGYAQGETIAEVDIFPPFVDNKQPLAKDTINCVFTVGSTSYYESDTTKNKERKIHHVANTNNPTTITFVGLDTKNPRFKSSSTTSSLKILINNDEIIKLENINFDMNITTYTVYKKEKIANASIMYKRNKGIELIFSHWIGYCY